MSANYLLEKLNLRAFRYCVLVTFLICNALVASSAVWNLDFVGNNNTRASLIGIDCYLTFLGCSGLFILFAIVFVELSRKHWSIGTVWFECIWVSLWGFMYLAGAITLTAIESLGDCTTTNPTQKCVSSQVLLAFTWLCTMTILIYLSVFIFAIFINKKKDPTIWHSTMRKFPWAGTCTILASGPPTPTVSRFHNTVPIIHAPKPKRAPAGNGSRSRIFSWRSGLSHDYHIEHYQPPSVIQGSRLTELPPAAAPPVIPAPALLFMEAEPAENNFASSLYPTWMQPAIINSNAASTEHLESSRPEAAPTSTLTTPAVQVPRATAQAALPPSPPPLGNWPRPDIISQPVRKVKRKQVPAPLNNLSRDVAAPQRSSSTRRESGASPAGGSQPNSPSAFVHVRPVGPRKKSRSADMTNRSSALDSRRVV